jgi:hypothetical protein
MFLVNAPANRQQTTLAIVCRALKIGEEMKNELTDEEKKKECERICGDSGKRGIHRTAPVLCPVQEELWKNPKKPPMY